MSPTNELPLPVPDEPRRADTTRPREGIEKTRRWWFSFGAQWRSEEVDDGFVLV